MSIDNPLREVLDIYCNVNSIEMVELLSENIKKYDSELVKKQLFQVISENQISVEEYEEITDDCYDTQEELNDWLKTIWFKMFGEDFPGK